MKKDVAISLIIIKAIYYISYAMRFIIGEDQRPFYIISLK